ncbi:tRNA guanosine(34) transglycosylase Tgt [Candidatus Pacearchaeota archaeon CG10_big_fil_rev_8_21_14_0_10_32_14]|nr:MAG: tRNA guanosine(34) transglycosylase Tgt [Candidatus Pacearchaeota archaeon CG10_big_fil_rev_8_21_14_0_10_32_14]
MTSNFSFEIKHKDPSGARAGIIRTRHGEIQTPYLVPVATRAEVNCLTKEDIEKLGVQALLCNTYHLWNNPGEKVMASKGGLHGVMDFNKPIFTDSGGFQVFSLGFGMEHNIGKLGFFLENQGKIPNKKPQDKYAIVEEDGVRFKTENGAERFLGPKESMEIQSALGADIIMAFDECTSPLHDEQYTRESLERTNRWALESLKYHDKNQALYGIIQGGKFKKLRDESSKFISSKPFDGIAIGGSLGDSKDDMKKILEWISCGLKKYHDERPIHMLGIGYIEDILECVPYGIDTFDCVDMTRVARHGGLFVSPKSGGSLENKFRINIVNSKYNSDDTPIDTLCECETCQNYSRKQLRELFKKGYSKKTQDKESQQLYNQIATYHNVHFMLNFMEQLRFSIKENKFNDFKESWMRN